MTERVNVCFNGVEVKAEAHVITTEKGCNIEFTDIPVVIDYSEERQP
jgi:hypothetical protein